MSMYILPPSICVYPQMPGATKPDNGIKSPATGDEMFVSHHRDDGN